MVDAPGLGRRSRGNRHGRTLLVDEILGTLGIAFLLVAVEPLWKGATQHVVRLIHEAGHGLALLLTGNWVKNLELHRTGGRTQPEKDLDEIFKPSVATAVVAGYPAPSVVGLLLANGVDQGWNASVVLGVLLLSLVGLVLFHGNLYTLVLIVSLGLVLALFFYVAAPVAQVGAVAAAAWVLLIGGLRRDVEILTERGPTTDQGRLQKITHIPADVWVGLFLVFGVFALVTGARWLLF